MLTSCDDHVTAEQAHELAEKEGLALVKSSRGATGFAGVTKGSSRARPFQVLDTRSTIDGTSGKKRRKSLGSFFTAEHAALVYARHVAEVGKRSRGGRRAGAGRKHADASEAEAWWNIHSSENRASVEAMSPEDAGEAAEKEGAVKVVKTLNPSGYKGVIKRTSTAEGGAAYSAEWHPCASDAKRLGKTTLRFGL